MAQKSINKLTNDELNLICSTTYPILKKSAMGKIREIFEETGKIIDDEIGIKLPDYKRNYKISSGENFEDCPYLVLDIPRIIPKNFDFVFRIFFRWGHHFSFQCLLNNEKFDSIKLFNKLKSKENEIFVLLGNDPWENKIEHDSYILIKDLSNNEFLKHQRNVQWFKFCKCYTIKKPENLMIEAFGFYKNILSQLELTAK